MQQPTPPGPDLPPAVRDDEEDFDLLTFSEAGVRLEETIAGAEATLVGLTGAEADALRARLALLREARERNGRRMNDESFEKRFGFKPRSATRD